MWRALFMAIGIGLCILGAECLVVERAVLAVEQRGTPAPDVYLESLGSLTDLTAVPPSRKTIEPPEWAPWSLLSAGTVVVLYSLTLRRGGGGGGEGP